MSDSDPDSSFEVVEEEILSSFADSSVETIGRDHLESSNSDGIWNACGCSHDMQLAALDLHSAPESSEHSEHSWTEASSAADLLTSRSSCTEGTIMLPPIPGNEKSICRRNRKKSIKQLSSNNTTDCVTAPKDNSACFTNGKLILIVIGLFGLTIALMYSTIRQAQLISHLREELAQTSLQYEKALREELEKHVEQDAKSRALIADLQNERHQLLSDLQTQLEQHSNRDSEARNTILELRTERRKLMDEIASVGPLKTEGKKFPCGKLKAQNEHLKKKLQKTLDELDDMKRVLSELRESSLCIPGMKFVNWALCKGLRLCPERYR